MMMMMMMMMQLEMILPNRAYAFFSHTHKAQKENMPLLDKVRVYVCVSNMFTCCSFSLPFLTFHFIFLTLL